MGRTVLAEENLSNVVNSFFNSQKWQLGLIIGQLTEQKDFVAHFARSPDPVEDEAEIESDEVECENDVKTTAEKNRKTSLKLSLSEEIDEKWITEHARQVNRMLPGGMNVIGMYVFSPPELINKNQTKLRQCMYGVHKVTERNKFLRSAMAHGDRIFIHICSSSRKVTCRTIDVTDNQATMRPAEFKYQSFLSKWHTIKSVADINVKFNIPVSCEKSRLEAQITLGLQNQLEEIWNGVAALNGKVLRTDEQLYVQAKTSKGKAGKDQSQTYNMELYTCNNCKSDEKIKKLTTIGMINFIGSLSSIAYVHGKATKGEAIKSCSLEYLIFCWGVRSGDELCVTKAVVLHLQQPHEIHCNLWALKMDIIRSILSRLQLLCEEAEVNNMYQVNEWSLVSPTRVFAPYKETPICFCDYIFKDERTQDSLERFSDLLSMKLSEEDLSYPERSPDIEEVAQMIKESGSDTPEEELEEASQNVEESKDSTAYFVVIALLLAIFAIVLGILLNR